LQPPVCDEEGNNALLKRRKRQTLELDETKGPLYDTDREDLKVKVYSGLYVNEANDLDDDYLGSDLAEEIVSFDSDNLIIRFYNAFSIQIVIQSLRSEHNLHSPTRLCDWHCHRRIALDRGRHCCYPYPLDQEKTTKRSVNDGIINL